ncbi:MAG: FtsX-like permease family protein [Candidatus Hodarchaeota archaeon]
MLKVIFLGLEMAFFRMRKLKVTTTIIIINVTIISSLLVSLTWGTSIIQINMISNSFNSILTDFNVRIIDEDSPDINIQELRDSIMLINNVEKAIIRLFPNPEFFSGSFFLSQNTTFNQSKAQNTNYFPIILGFSSSDFEFYQDLINQATNIKSIELNDNETVISSITAKRLNLTLGDSLFLQHQNTSIQSNMLKNTSSRNVYPLKIVEIWNLTTIINEVLSDIMEIPVKEIHDIPKFTDFVLIGNHTYLNCMNNFFPNFSIKTILNNGIISIFINHESLIDRKNITSMVDRYTKIRNSLGMNIEDLKPLNTEIIWSSNLEQEINMINIAISDSTFKFVLFGSLLICLLLFFYFIFIQQKIHQSRHFFGIIRLRGGKKSLIYTNFLSEGVFFGLFGGSLSIFLSAGLMIGINSYFFPNTSIERFILDYLYLDPLTFVLANELIGITLGLIGHALIFLQVNDTTLMESIMRTKKFDHYNKTQLLGIWRYFLIFGFVTIFTWFFSKFLVIFDIGGVWSYFLYTVQEILSLFLVLTPISLIFGFLGFFIHKRDRIEHFFSPLVKPILKNLTPLFFKDFWRRSKQTLILIFLISLTTFLATTPVILIATQEKIAEKNIVRGIGSDIRLNGQYLQFEEVKFQNFITNNSNIIIKSSYIISFTGFFYGGSTGSVFSPIVALNTPTTFMKTIHIEELSGSLQKETKELLNLVTENNVIVPIGYHERYTWNIGDIRKVILSDGVLQKTIKFSIVGFYQWIPGLELSNNPLSLNGIICDFDYLENQTDFSGSIDTTLMIQLNKTISDQKRELFYQIIRSNFPSLQIEILEDRIINYQNSFEGRFIYIFDIIFFLAIILGSIVIISFVLLILYTERQDFAIFRSRGLKKISIIQLCVVRILVIELLGIGMGIFIGFISTLIYIESILPQFGIYDNLLTIDPFIKSLSFLIVMLTIHINVAFISLILLLKHDIIGELHFKE